MIWTHAAAALAALAVGFAGGWRVQALRWAAADGERAAVQAESEQLLRRAADAAAIRFEVERNAMASRRVVITREVDRVVESPVYRDLCLDAAGLRVLANAIGSAGDTREPASAMSGADDAH